MKRKALVFTFVAASCAFAAAAQAQGTGAANLTGSLAGSLPDSGSLPAPGGGMGSGGDAAALSAQITSLLQSAAPGDLSASTLTDALAGAGGGGGEDPLAPLRQITDQLPQPGAGGELPNPLANGLDLDGGDNAGSVEASGSFSMKASFNGRSASAALSASP